MMFRLAKDPRYVIKGYICVMAYFLYVAKTRFLQ